MLSSLQFSYALCTFPLLALTLCLTNSEEQTIVCYYVFSFSLFLSYFVKMPNAVNDKFLKNIATKRKMLANTWFLTGISAGNNINCSKQQNAALCFPSQKTVPSLNSIFSERGIAERQKCCRFY